MNDLSQGVSLRNVLLLEGGAALGAYQVGVIDALLGAGRMPEWVVGTSIGAINGALLAGNQPHRRQQRLHEFWSSVSRGMPRGGDPAAASLIGAWQAFHTMSAGIPGFFFPRLASYFPLGLRTEPNEASYYDVSPLRTTLERLVDFDFLAHSPIRLSVSAVDVESGRIRYFDSRHERLGVDHIMAACALPPAFPAVAIDGRNYWDGSIHAHMPLEYVLQDQPRRSSLCFLTTLWPLEGGAPDRLSEVLERTRDIQSASRATTLLAMEKELHRLRHAVAVLAARLPKPEMPPETLAASRLGCQTVFHVVPLQAPHLPGEDHLKDLEFVPERVAMRRQAGFEDTRGALAAQRWTAPHDAFEGLIVHRAGCSEPVIA